MYSFHCNFYATLVRFLVKLHLLASLIIFICHASRKEVVFYLLGGMEVVDAVILFTLVHISHIQLTCSPKLGNPIRLLSSGIVLGIEN